MADSKETESGEENQDDDEVLGGLFVKAKHTERKIQAKKDLNGPENTRLHTITEQIDYTTVS